MKLTIKFLFIGSTGHKEVAIDGYVNDNCDDCSCWPLTPLELHCINNSQAMAIDLIDLNGVLIDRMTAVGCINVRQQRFIKELRSSDEKIRCLFDIMTRRSQRSFRLFLDCLRRDSQGHVADIIQMGGKFISIKLYAIEG
jgi:hypothetical protein